MLTTSSLFNLERRREKSPPLQITAPQPLWSIRRANRRAGRHALVCSVQCAGGQADRQAGSLSTQTHVNDQHSIRRRYLHHCRQTKGAQWAKCPSARVTTTPHTCCPSVCTQPQPRLLFVFVVQLKRSCLTGSPKEKSTLMAVFLSMGNGVWELAGRINPFTAMLARQSLGKRPMKVPNLKSLRHPPPPLHLPTHEHIKRLLSKYTVLKVDLL